MGRSEQRRKREEAFRRMRVENFYLVINLNNIIRWEMVKAIRNFRFYKKRVELNKYHNMRPNLNEHEINQIYQTFQLYNAHNGFVKSKDILAKYQTTSDCENMKK